MIKIFEDSKLALKIWNLAYKRELVSKAISSIKYLITKLISGIMICLMSCYLEYIGREINLLIDI